MTYIFGGTRPDAAPAPDPVDDACGDDCDYLVACVVCDGTACLHVDSIDCPDMDGPAHFPCHDEACRVCWEQDEAERRGDEIRAGDW